MTGSDGAARGAALRVLLTGGRGFVGRRLAALIAAEEPGWRVVSPGGPGCHGGERLDVTDPHAVNAWVNKHRPDVVVHLAAITAVPSAAKDPRAAWDVNLGGALNIVLALQRHAPAAHLMLVSTAEVYGASLGGAAPADESTLLQPLNAYAASKAAADLLVRQAAAEGLPACVMRPFNHTGPGQSEAFVAPAFAAQIARIEAGLQPPVLHVGGLDDARDFLDVDDVAAAYLAVLRQRDGLAPGEVFNVASGRATRVRTVLEILLAHACTPVEVRVDAARLRPTAPRQVVGDASHLRARTGWAPRRDLERTLLDLLEDQRVRLR